MTRKELESTSPMNRADLLGLLDAMTEAGVTAPRTKNRNAQRAALLPPCPPIRFPRATPAPPLVSVTAPSVCAEPSAPVETAPVHDDQVVYIHSAPIPELCAARPRDRLPFEIIASIAALLVVGLWALYLVL